MSEAEIHTKVRAAVVGVGYLGQFHAEKYAKSKCAVLAGIVDVDREKTQKLAKKLRCSALSDYRELPKLGVQCASVSSTTSTHFEIASWLLKNGIDVLVEKPITTNSDEAQELIEIAEAEGRILQAGHLERFNPAVQEMEKVLTHPRFFEVRRVTPFSGRGIDVDVVLDLMIHDIDIVAHLVNRPLLKVEAIGIPVITESFDIVNARLTFEGGAVANVTASRAALKSERTIRVFQPELYISLDYGKRRLKIYSINEPGADGKFPEVHSREQKVRETDALEEEIESFIGCVLGRKTPKADGYAGKRALELAERIQQAVAEGVSQIELPEEYQAKIANL